MFGIFLLGIPWVSLLCGLRSVINFGQFLTIIKSNFFFFCPIFFLFLLVFQLCGCYILREIRPGCSLKGLMLNLKHQYFVHLMRTADSFEKTLMLGKTEGRRRRGRQRMRWLQGITDTMEHGFWWTLGVGDGQGRPGVLRFMGSQRVGHDWATELNWTYSLPVD